MPPLDVKLQSDTYPTWKEQPTYSPSEVYLGFGTGVLEEVDFTEVVSHGHHPFTVGATQRIDVRAIRALQPHTWNTTAAQVSSATGCNNSNVKMERLSFSPMTWKPSTHV